MHGSLCLLQSIKSFTQLNAVLGAKEMAEWVNACGVSMRTEFRCLEPMHVKARHDGVSVTSAFLWWDRKTVGCCGNSKHGRAEKRRACLRDKVEGEKETRLSSNSYMDRHALAMALALVFSSPSSILFPLLLSSSSPLLFHIRACTHTCITFF